MASKKKYDKEDGVWRTIGGRRVFIRTGQSLSSAMKESGKFSKSLKQTRDEYDKEIRKQQDESRALNGRKNYAQRKFGELSEEYDTLNKEYTESQDKIAKLKADKMLAEHETVRRITNVDLPNEFGVDIKQEQFDRLKNVGTKNTNWREQVKKNNIQLEKDIENYKKTHDMSRESDGYYELFRENERRNAKIKQEVPEEPYEYVDAYAGYRDKRDKIADKNEKRQDEGGLLYDYDKHWTGKEYTNDEFMEHLTDSNWHTERKMLEEAGLTNQELAYIKDNTKLSLWSADLDKNSTQKLIDEAKAKFRGNNKNANEAEKYYSKLSQYQAREDLNMRKQWLDENRYDESMRKEYEDFYNQGEEYYNRKYNALEEIEKKYNPFVTSDDRVSVVKSKDIANGTGYIGYDTKNNAYHNAYKSRDSKDINTSGPYRTLEEAERDLDNIYSAKGKTPYNSKAYAKELSQAYMAEEEYEDKKTPKYIQDIDSARYGNMSDEDAIKEWLDGGADIIYQDDARAKLKEWGVAVKNDDPYETYKNELTKQLLPIYKQDKYKSSLGKMPLGDLKDMAENYNINVKGLSRQELIEKLMAIYMKNK